MNPTHIRTRAQRLWRRASALAAIGLTTLGMAAGLAPAALAQPANGPVGSPSKGCPVEDEHGNVSYVPVGTRIGMFSCGSDGEWHFGLFTRY